MFSQIRSFSIVPWFKKNNKKNKTFQLLQEVILLMIFQQKLETSALQRCGYLRVLFFLFLLFVNRRCGLGWVNTDTPGYLAETEHTYTHTLSHIYTHTPIHIQSFWVMGTRWCARTVFILYGFLFECVLLTGLLMASSFPGQGSVIRPYPGHAKRARTPENKVPDPPQGLPKFDLGNESADLPRERRLLRVDYRGSQSLLLLASSSEASSAQLPFFFFFFALARSRIESPVSRTNAKLIWCGQVTLQPCSRFMKPGSSVAKRALAFQMSRPQEERCISAGVLQGGISALQKECKSDIWAWNFFSPRPGQMLAYCESVHTASEDHKSALSSSFRWKFLTATL